MGKKIPVFLSNKDEYVSDNYIGIYELATNGDYALAGYSKEQWCLGYKAVDELRRKTFIEARKRFELSGASSFNSYWNGNLDAINELGINQFVKLPAFFDLCQAMICFETTIQNKTNSNKRKYVSFGISKDIFKRYSESLRIAFETGSAVQPVSLYDKHKKRFNKLFEMPRTALKFEGQKAGEYRWVEIHKNEIFLMFEQWCRLKKKTKKQALYEAMALIMKTDPANGLDDIKAFTRKIDVNSNEVVLTGEINGCKTIKVELPIEVSNKVDDIVRRYNSDPENSGKPNLTASVYAAQAINSFNNKISLKYSDPVAYKEYLAIKEIENYNKNIKQCKE